MVQLVAQIRAMIEELFSAKTPLQTVQKMTTILHDQPVRCFLNTSLPRLPLAIWRSAEAVERDAETIARAKRCCPKAGRSLCTRVGSTMSGFVMPGPRMSLERALAKYAPPTTTERASIARGAAFLVSCTLFRAKCLWII